MKWKLPVALGIVVWLLIFAEYSLLMFSPIDPISFYAIHYIAVIVFTLVISYAYFHKTRGTWKKGLHLGVWFLVVGAILDILITVPFFVKTYEYYLNPALWVGFITLLITASISGYFFGKQPKRQIPNYYKE